MNFSSGRCSRAGSYAICQLPIVLIVFGNLVPLFTVAESCEPLNFVNAVTILLQSPMWEGLFPGCWTDST